MRGAATQDLTCRSSLASFTSVDDAATLCAWPPWRESVTLLQWASERRVSGGREPRRQARPPAWNPGPATGLSTSLRISAPRRLISETGTRTTPASGTDRESPDVSAVGRPGTRSASPPVLPELGGPEGFEPGLVSLGRLPTTAQDLQDRWFREDDESPHGPSRVAGCLTHSGPLARPCPGRARSRRFRRLHLSFSRASSLLHSKNRLPTEPWPASPGARARADLRRRLVREALTARSTPPTPAFVFCTWHLARMITDVPLVGRGSNLSHLKPLSWTRRSWHRGLFSLSNSL